MFLCDACGAKAVKTGESKTLREIFKNDKIPFEDRYCGRCGKKGNCMLYPTVTVRETGAQK